jgi:uncharacterized protein (DUF1697 family)
MAELRNLLDHHGLKEVQTYIQSGNLVFKSDLTKQQVVTTIAESILKHFGFEVPVLVLTSNEIAAVINRNPYKKDDLTRLHVTFLAEGPSKEKLHALPASPNPREKYQVKDLAIYVYCPDGYGRTKINNNFFEKKLMVSATTRNWKTCMKLSEMAEF